MQDIEQRLRAILQARLNVDAAAVSSDSKLSDHGDSLDFVDVLGDVEASFDLELSNEQIARIKTFADLSQAVQESLLVAR